jgi:UDP-N-acetylmuramoylalanine-D-glutamate ligase
MGSSALMSIATRAMFANYAARGEAFVAAVRQLAGGPGP